MPMQIMTAVVLLFGFMVPVVAQTSSTTTTRVDVERLMSVEEFRNAGLEKLTAPELAALNTWFQQYISRNATSVAPIKETGRASTTWLALDSNTLRLIQFDGEHLYAEAFSRDGAEALGTYDLVKQMNGTFTGHENLKWSCKFWCHDISCMVEQWVENTCTTQNDVVLMMNSEARIEGYVVAPKAPAPLDKSYAAYCRRCGVNL